MIQSDLKFRQAFSTASKGSNKIDTQIICEHIYFFKFYNETENT